jgi:FtsP/CotA-like multicopper oxidase with cupredoxin domain
MATSRAPDGSWRALLAGAALAGAALATVAGEAPAQPREQGIRNPPEAPIRRSVPRPTSARLEAAPAAGVGREATLTLTVALATTTIWHPGTQQYDRVRLRSYQTPQTDPAAPLVAPTIRTFPGETVRLTLENKLDPEPSCQSSAPNIPHCFNTTNLHAHGLWVSPTGNSDNVLIAIRPTQTFDYEYNIPADHPAGTFWYHPHRHGSTALQVGSGMAGALIIDGVRLPAPGAPGDIDTLLKHADGTPFRERVLVLQQIPYACRDAGGNVKKNADRTWRCDPPAPPSEGDLGQIEKYDEVLTGLGAWPESGRYTTINGRTVEPLVDKAVVGQVERWRVVHAGVRSTIKLQLRKLRPGAAPSAGLPAAAQTAWIDANCDAVNLLDHFEIAADGLTREQILSRKTTFLQPGYRSDLLIVFPADGQYCVVDDEARGPQAVNGDSIGRKLLTVVTVEGGPPIADPAAHLKQALKTAARTHMPDDVRQAIEADLDSGLRLRSFVPHGDLRPVAPSATQTLLFAMPPQIGTDASDLHAYDPTKIDRRLTLGATEDWILESQALGHPFHIHVNPFQVLSVVNKNTGADLTQDPTSEYFGLSGVWKDTLFVPSNATITVRTRYRRYIGKFVLHCHILDHEDRGMMQNVCIDLPDGSAGSDVCQAASPHP